MSLFGNHSSSKSLFSGGDAGKRVSPPHKFDWGAAALSFMGVDPNIFIGRRRAEAAQAAEQQVRAGLKARGYSDSDIDVLMSDPKQASALMAQVLQPRQYGASGGTTDMPGMNGQAHNWTTAPRFDDNGTIYGPGNGTAPPPILQHGTKAVPVQPGGQVQIVDSITGQPIMQGGGAASPPAGAPTLSGPSPEAAAYLRQHPELAPAFDAKYGSGSSRSILGQGGASPSNGSATFP